MFLNTRQQALVLLATIRYTQSIHQIHPRRTIVRAAVFRHLKAPSIVMLATLMEHQMELDLAMILRISLIETANLARN